MSPSEKNSSNFVETKQDDLKMMQDSSLNSDIVHDPKKLKDRIIDLVKGDTEFSKMKQEDKALVVGTASGLFTAVLPLLAVGATLAIPGAIVGLTLYFAVKVAVSAVQSGYKGLKWSAEKTVEGAKHIGEKIKDGYEYSADSLKRGASFVSEKTKEKTSDIFTATANKLYRAAGNENYSDRIDNELIPDSPQKKRIQGVKEDLRAICADEKSNSTLIKSILSGISEKIEEKIAKETYLDWRDYLPDQLVDKWREQKKFIDNLDADGLRNLVTKRLSDKDKYFRDSIFSEHHDEIMKIATDHKISNSVNKLDRIAGKYGIKKGSTQSVDSSLENSLSESSSMDSLSSYSTTSSKAKLLNSGKHKEVNAISSLKSKLPSWLGGEKAPKKVTCTGYKRISEDEMTSTEIGNSRLDVASPRNNSSVSAGSTATVSSSSSDSLTQNASSTVQKLTRSSSVDSGIDSLKSSPQHGMLTKENGELKTQADLRKTGSLDKLVEPSSTVTVDTDVEQQASKTNERQ